jgi:sugar/nucleoside kinase (ribokinase family)
MQLDVYAFGSALIDMQVPVPDSVLTELGIEKGNMYLTSPERQQAVLHLLRGAHGTGPAKAEGVLSTAAGGSAANTMFGIAQLGGRAGLCGKVAHDDFGDLYISHMQASGVTFDCRKAPGITGSCIVLISPDAQRTMLTHLGLSSEISAEDIRDDLIQTAAYIYLEGYLFDSPLATRTMLAAIATARNHGVRIALTASDAFCVERHRDVFLDLLRKDVDLLFANVQEACALSDTSNAADALRVLSGMCDNIALTDGGSGSILSFGATTVPITPFPANAIDTTGAGDSYAAGLLFGLTHGYTLERSGQLASSFAARVVSEIGPRFTGDIRAVLGSDTCDIPEHHQR